LVIRWPGRFRSGLRVQAPVSLVDLYPTFLEIAGIELPKPLFTNGRSLGPLLKGKPDEFEGGDIFCEFEGEGWNHPRAFLRKGNFKFVYNHTADCRLYDLQTDPQEMNDLGGKRGNRGILNRIRRELLSGWDPAEVEKRVLLAQERRKIARCKNVCKDLGW
jgi:choline-sulfatase